MAHAPPVDPTEMTMEMAAGLFVARLPDRIAQLRTAASEGRAADVRRTAHQLKGSGGGFGFPQISLAAGHVERAALAADTGWEAVAEAIDRLAATAAGLPGSLRTSKIAEMKD